MINHEKHPIHWFSDGTVVLAVKLSTPAPTLGPNTATTCSSGSGRKEDEDDKMLLYRVYMGYLARCSPVFENMFGDAKPEAGQTFEGVPLVYMQHDSKEEVDALLDVMFGRRRCVSLSFEIVS